MLNPYETLANAIIEQAAKDHQRATAYLKKNPRTKELAERVATEIAEREKRRAERKANKLPLPHIKKSREERQMDSIISHETLRYDAEKFSRSAWFGVLSDLDGTLLLSRLKEMEAGL